MKSPRGLDPLAGVLPLPAQVRRPPSAASYSLPLRMNTAPGSLLDRRRSAPRSSASRSARWRRARRQRQHQHGSRQGQHAVSSQRYSRRNMRLSKPQLAAATEARPNPLAGVTAPARSAGSLACARHPPGRRAVIAAATSTPPPKTHVPAEDQQALVQPGERQVAAAIDHRVDRRLALVARLPVHARVDRFAGRLAQRELAGARHHLHASPPAPATVDAASSA